MAASLTWSLGVSDDILPGPYSLSDLWLTTVCAWTLFVTLKPGYLSTFTRPTSFMPEYGSYLWHWTDFQFDRTLCQAMHWTDNTQQ